MTSKSFTWGSKRKAYGANADGKKEKPGGEKSMLAND